MRTTFWSGSLLLASLSLVGCERVSSSTESIAPAAAPSAPAPVEMAAMDVPQANLARLAAPQQRPGTTLAYAHSVSIELGEEAIPSRIDALQRTCLAQPDGACELLNVAQVGGEHPSGAVTMRVVPSGVDPLVQQAASDGEIAERTVHADDLAEAVADNTLRRSRLEKEHVRLQEFQDRPNVKLGDMLKLSARLAEVEAQLDWANQESAQQRRRIDKELLTVQFRPKGVEVGGSAVGDALRDSLEIVGRSTAWLIRSVAASIPAIVVLFGVWMTWRIFRRRRVVATASA
jgi:hypothetical protein